MQTIITLRTYLLIFFALLLLPWISSYGQDLDMKWAYSMGLSNEESTDDIVVDVDGNIFAVGTYKIYTELDFSHLQRDTLWRDQLWASGDAYGSNQNIAFLAKYDANGKYLWSKNIADVSHSGFIRNPKIALDKEGNIYVVGEFQDTLLLNSGQDTLISIPNPNTSWNVQDVFMVKYDKGGQYIWARQIGGDGVEYIGGIVVGSAGDIYLTGSFGGFGEIANIYTGMLTLDGSTANNPSRGSYDIFITKYDNNGNYIWGKTVGGLGNDYGIDICVDKDDNISIVGGYDTTGGVDFDPDMGVALLSSDSIHAMFIAQYDKNGKYLWVKNISIKQGFQGYPLASGPAKIKLKQDKENNIFIAGHFTGKVDFDPGVGVSLRESTLGPPGFNGLRLPSQDIFLIKCDERGNLIWNRHIGGKGLDFLGGISIGEDGNLYITGTFAVSYPVATDTCFFYGTNSVIDTFITPLGRKGAREAQGDMFLAVYKTINGELKTINIFGGGEDTRTGFALFNRYINSIAVDTNSNSVYLSGYIPHHLTIEFPYPSTDTLLSVGGDGFLIKFSSECNVYNIVYESACGNFVFNDELYTVSGTYVDTFSNQEGCDSFVLLHLNIIGEHTKDSLVVGNYCDSVTLNGKTYTHTTVDTLHYTNITGCDSNIIYDITIGAKDSSVLIETACDSLVVNDTLVFKESGNYTFMLLNDAGCDSTIRLSLTIISSPEAIATNGGDILVANSGEYSYQWLDCDDDHSLLTDATERNFMPTKTGNYAVVVTSEGCSDTSECVYFDNTSNIQEWISNGEINIYPNPTNSTITINSEQPAKYGIVRLYQSTGRLLLVKNDLKGTEHTIDLSAYTSGVYFLEWEENNHKFHFKVVKY